MSELTDLEKLKQEVENLKRYLRGQNTIMYDISQLGLGDFRQSLVDLYSVLSETQEDLMDGKHSDEYEEFLNDFDDKYTKPRRDALVADALARKSIEKKGGKTRKNRKSRK
jgi:hypothetical protein